MRMHAKMANTYIPSTSLSTLLILA